MTDDDIYNRIIEFKAKTEITQMSRNYWAVILTKEYGQTNTYMSIMLVTKITLDM